jgi:Transcriptional regulator, AbiEi antitoxin, Type IV TA system
VKRLFLYIAEKTGHHCFNHLDVTKIDLGKGKRSIVKNGVFVNKYGITVPFTPNLAKRLF